MTTRQRLIKLADALWRKCIHRLYCERCLLCGKKGDDPHHLVGRRYLRTRWKLSNGALLCRKCHCKVEKKTPERWKKIIDARKAEANVTGVILDGFIKDQIDFLKAVEVALNHAL